MAKDEPGGTGPTPAEDLQAFAALTAAASDTPIELTPDVHRGRLPRLHITVLVAVLLVVAALIVIALALRSGETTDTEGASGPAPAAPTAPAAPAADAAAAPQSIEDCAVDPAVVSATADLTSTSSTDHATVFQGVATLTNTADVPVYVALRLSQSTGSAERNGRTDEGWFGGPYLLAPGESREERLSAQEFTDGEETWTLVTDYAAFAGTTACLDLMLEADPQGYEDLATRIPDPFPAGPAS